MLIVKHGYSSDFASLINRLICSLCFDIEILARLFEQAMQVLLIVVLLVVPQFLHSDPKKYFSPFVAAASRFASIIASVVG